MRYDKRLKFVKVKRKYDPDKSKEVDGDVLYQDILPADISSIPIDVQQAIFGNINPDRWTARLQRPYTEEFTYVEFNGKHYKAIFDGVNRRNTVFKLEPR